MVGYRQNLAPKKGNENRNKATTRYTRNDGGKYANEDDDKMLTASARSLLVTSGGKKHSRLELGPPRLCVLCEDDVAGTALPDCDSDYLVGKEAIQSFLLYIASNQIP